MRNGHARVQAFSISPALKQHTERLQPSKRNRRVTIAGPYKDASQTPERVSRVEKATDVNRRRRRSVSQDLAGKLDEAFDVKRDELGNWAEGILGEEQTRVNEELLGLEDHFASRLKFMQDLEDLVDAPFGTQTSGTITLEDETGKLEEVDIVIEDRMQDYCSTIEQEEEKLKALSRQWDVSQLEMICLAVEVLGVSRAEVQENEALETALKHLDNAGILHKDKSERYVEARNNVSAFNTELKGLCDETTKATKAIQTSWRTERKKILDNIKKALGGLNGVF